MRKLGFDTIVCPTFHQHCVQPAGWGLLISVAMFTINSSQSLVMNYYFFLGLHTALHVKVDLLDMLYQKSLRLGVDVRNARGVGTVVNLQSNDASKVWMMPVHIHTLWNSPFQVSSAAFQQSHSAFRWFWLSIGCAPLHSLP